MRSVARISVHVVERCGREERRRPTVVVIVAHYYFLNQSVLAQLAPDILVEGVKVHLHLRRAHFVLGVVGGILVQIRKENGLRVRGLDVFARAAVAMSTGSYLIIETAIDL
jgi:hypothetical protein